MQALGRLRSPLQFRGVAAHLLQRASARFTMGRDIEAACQAAAALHVGAATGLPAGSHAGPCEGRASPTGTADFRGDAAEDREPDHGSPDGEASGGSNMQHASQALGVPHGLPDGLDALSALDLEEHHNGDREGDGGGSSSQGTSEGEGEGSGGGGRRGGDKSALKAERKAAKKAAKAQKREAREGRGGSGKECDLCLKTVDLLIRCQVDETRAWKMVCGKCWKDVSGGVTDGDAAHPHYRYGGLWRRR